MSFTSHIGKALALTAALSLAAQTPEDLQKRDVSLRKLNPDATAGAPAQVPRGYAVLVGVANYRNLAPEEQLKFPESDAEAMYRVLISKENGQFPPENVHRLIGGQATLQNIRFELEEWLPSVATESDRVVVYFAGHGLVADGRGYIAPWDVDVSDLEHTAYPMNQLAKVLGEKVKARWKVLLADACHSQKINAETTDDAIDNQFNQLFTGFLTFTATREREVSYEDKELHAGIFTYFLMKGLQGQGDANCDGIITADEIIEYVRENVRNYVRARGYSQTPVERGDFQANTFVLAVDRPSSCSNNAELTPPADGGLIIETNMDEVQVFVDDKLEGTAQRGKPLRVPGLAVGSHVIKGLRKGYQPDTQSVWVYPGRDQAVTLRIQYRLEYKRSAVEAVERGEKILFGRRSSGLLIGAYLPDRQTENDLQQARRFFFDALRQERGYALAAFDLAMVCQLLPGESKCMLDAFRRAIRIDPAYVAARVQYGGALIEEGDPDEAIRQLEEALRIEPNNDVAYSHLSRAFLDKGVWARAVESADRAISKNPRNDQAFLWKADALRHMGGDEHAGPKQLGYYERAINTYAAYLQLTNFSSPGYEKIAYYFVGFGIGSRRHADRTGVYAFQRSLAYMGLCDSDRHLGNLSRAMSACERAIAYDANEPLTYFLLGNVYRDMFLKNREMFLKIRRKDDLLSACTNYTKLIRLNPDLDASSYAKAYIQDIDRILATMNGHCSVEPSRASIGSSVVSTARLSVSK